METINLIFQCYLNHSSVNRIKTTSKNQILSITSPKGLCGASL